MKIIARPFLYILLTTCVNPPVAAGSSGSFSSSFKNWISDPELTNLSDPSRSIQDNCTAFKTLTVAVETTIPRLSYCTAIASNMIYQNRSLSTSLNNIVFALNNYNTDSVKSISISDEGWTREGRPHYV